MRTNIVYAFLFSLAAVNGAPIEASQASDLNQLGENAELTDNAQLLDNAQFADNAQLADNTQLADNAQAVDNSELTDNTQFANSTLLIDASGLEQSAQEADLSELDVEGKPRKKDIKYDRQPPARENCPATNNGRGRNYEAHTYTNKQLMAAFRTGAVYQSGGDKVGDQQYPHPFNNKEKLEFPCGKDKMEFPILTDGKVYRGGDVSQFPDRLVYEWKQDGKYLKVKFCGVMRHGPGANFISCGK